MHHLAQLCSDPMDDLVRVCVTLCKENDKLCEENDELSAKGNIRRQVIVTLRARLRDEMAAQKADITELLFVLTTTVMICGEVCSTALNPAAMCAWVGLWHERKMLFAFTVAIRVALVIAPWHALYSVVITPRNVEYSVYKGALCVCTLMLVMVVNVHKPGHGTPPAHIFLDILLIAIITQPVAAVIKAVIKAVKRAVS